MTYNLKNYSNLGRIHIARWFQGRMVQRGLAAAQKPSGRWAVVYVTIDNSERSVGVEKAFSKSNYKSQRDADVFAMGWVGESSYL